MTAAYRIYTKSCIHNLQFSKYGNQQPNTFSQLHYVHIYIPIHNFKVFPYKILLTTALVQIVRRILICSSVRSSCTRKIVFKIQNNELNELSECMFYKMFCFSGKHLKTVKLSFRIIFQKPCLLTLKFLKLSVLACF